MQINSTKSHQLLDKIKNNYPKATHSVLENSMLLISLILIKETVNLNTLKNQLGSVLGNVATKADSHYKRLIRFFGGHYEQYCLWKILLSMAFLLIRGIDGRYGGRYLVMDATCWELGTVKYQFLVLSVIYHGVSIPIFWVELSKKGHSNTTERKRLLQMAGLLYNLKGMTLLADREYIGRDWFEWLNSQGIFFLIRIPYGNYSQEVSGKLSYSHLIKKAKKGKCAETSLLMAGMALRLLATASPRDEKGLLLVITNRKGLKCHALLDIYRLRWKIETMFFHWKSNGFHFEELNLTHPAKVRLMVSLLVLAYVLCVCEGLANMESIRKKKSGNLSPYRSIFKKGYEIVCNHIANIVLFLDYLLQKKVAHQKPNFKPK